MKAIFKPTFEIDVSDWYADEAMPKKERIERIKEDLEDMSVFMIHATYEALQDVEVKVTP